MSAEYSRRASGEDNRDQSAAAVFPVASPGASCRRGASFWPDPVLTFPEVFARRVAETPQEVAFLDVTMVGREPHVRPLTYAWLDGMVRQAAAALRARGVRPGDRVILALSAPDRFFAFFLGAQGLGAAPVPLPSLADFQVPAACRDRIRAVAADCTPRVLVLDSPRGWEPLAGELAGVGSILEAAVLDLGAASFKAVPGYDLCRPFDEVAYLQYTSGSTGAPKGVVVTQHNLVANFRASAAAAALGLDDRNFSWLPLFHDMGLIGGFLQTIYLGIPTYVMAPRYFLARPDSWLRAIARFRITLSTGPTFAYGVLARRLPEQALAGLDLSTWRLAFAGAEPIDHRTVEAFIRRFAPHGFQATSFYPVYGLAECTLSAAYPQPGVPPRYDYVARAGLSLDGRAVPVADGEPDAVTFVSVGRAIPDHRLRILDPNGDAEFPERRIGEIVIEGPSVTPGYFQPSGDPVLPRRELRTGDLGYVADGELFIVDRLKDLVIIAGRNYVPCDIERVVGAVPGVRAGAVIAFALPGVDGTDQLYIVAGTEMGAGEPEQLCGAVRRAVQGQIGIAPQEVCLVRSGVLPKTSSGKLQRGACRHLYVSGAFRREDKLSKGAA